jgi:putative sigma-54 modulation protein
MQMTITGRNMEVTPALKEFAEEKIQKISKYLHKINNIHVILTVEKYRHIAEVILTAHGNTLTGVEETDDMYSSIDKVMDKMEIQARKLSGRIKEKNKGLEEGEDGGAEESSETGEAGAGQPQIKRKSFNPKPMTVDDAVMHLEGREDRFFVFVESRSGRINVLYRRDDGKLGLIETV